MIRTWYSYYRYRYVLYRTVVGLWCLDRMNIITYGVSTTSRLQYLVVAESCTVLPGCTSSCAGKGQMCPIRMTYYYFIN
jgi:hypothetical protein